MNHHKTIINHQESPFQHPKPSLSITIHRYPSLSIINHDPSQTIINVATLNMSTRLRATLPVQTLHHRGIAALDGRAPRTGRGPGPPEIPTGANSQLSWDNGGLVWLQSKTVDSHEHPTKVSFFELFVMFFSLFPNHHSLHQIWSLEISNAGWVMAVTRLETNTWLPQAAFDSAFIHSSSPGRGLQGAPWAVAPRPKRWSTRWSRILPGAGHGQCWIA